MASVFSVATSSESNCSRMADRAKLFNLEHDHILRNDWKCANHLIAVLDDNEDVICCGISGSRTSLTTDIANSPGARQLLVGDIYFSGLATIGIPVFFLALGGTEGGRRPTGVPPSAACAKPASLARQRHGLPCRRSLGGRPSASRFRTPACTVALSRRQIALLVLRFRLLGLLQTVAG